MGHGLDGLDTDFWDVKCYLEKSASNPSNPRPIVVVCEGRLRFYNFFCKHGANTARVKTDHAIRCNFVAK